MAARTYVPAELDAQPHVSSLDAHVGFWLRLVSNHVSARFQREVEAAGVSLSEWVALRQLYGAERATPAVLVEALGMTKGAVSKVLDRLEEKGLATRLADPEDRRAQHLALTPAGRALVPRLAALADANDAHFFDALPPAGREALVDVLRALAHAHHLTHVPVA